MARAGEGGLSLAALLGRKGYEVTVYEKNDILGGTRAVIDVPE
ncbi:NAD(P)-binding protein [Thermoproteota archaeon]